MTEVYIPKGYAVEDPNYYVSINGTAYILPKGKKVEVPDWVAAEIERSNRAQAAWEARSDQLKEAAGA